MNNFKHFQTQYLKTIEILKTYVLRYQMWQGRLNNTTLT